MGNQYTKMFSEGGVNRRDLLKTMAALGIVPVSTLIGAPQAGAAGTLSVFTQSLYALDKVYPDYTGPAKAEFSVFAEHNEAVEKVRSGYRPDLVCPNAYVTPRFVEDGTVRPIDTSKIESWDTIFPSILQYKDLQVDGKYYSVPWAWCPLSVMYRTDLANKYVGQESWAILWDEEYKGKLSQRDSGEISAIQALIVKGHKDPYAAAAANMEEIREMLKKQKELLRFYWQSETEVAQAVVSGEVIASYAWPSTFQIAKRAGSPVTYMKPKEGALASLDAFLILADAKASEDEIYAFINASLGQKCAQFLTAEYGIGSCNKAAFDTVDKKTLDDLGYDDPEAMLATITPLAAFSTEDRNAILAMFEEVKAGL